MTQIPTGREQRLPAPGFPATSPRLVQRSPSNLDRYRAAFDPCFDRVYTYTHRRIPRREACERIVRRVLSECLDLLVHGIRDERDLCRLKGVADRLIALEASRDASPAQVDP